MPDRRDFAELYDRYVAEVYSLAVRGTGTRDAAADVVVETFVRAWNSGRTEEQWLLDTARQIAGGGSTTGPPTGAPPPDLRRRVLTAIGAAPRRFGAAPFLAALCLLLLFAAFYFSTREKGFAIETEQLRAQLRNDTIRLTDFTEAAAILRAPDCAMSAIAQGKLFKSASRGVVLVAAHLQAGKTYEVTLDNVAAATVNADANGNALFVHREPVKPGAVIKIELKADR